MNKNKTPRRNPRWSGDQPTSAEEGRERIIDAFIKRTLVLGYDKVNMAEVARAAGVTRPTVYKYFDNITDLYLAAVGKVFERNARELAQHLTRYRSLERQLTEALLRLNKDSSEDGLYARFLRSILDPESVRKVPANDREHAQSTLMGIALDPIFTAHPELGKHRAYLLDIFTRISVSVLFRPFPDEKTIRQTVRMLVHGLDKKGNTR